MPGIKRGATVTDSKPIKKAKTDFKKPKPTASPGKPKSDPKTSKTDVQKPKVEEIYNTKSSKEAHAKQKAVAKERKLAKPNADSIHRAKKLWEKLRIKSAVPKDERKALVDELFSIITGRVKEFVFKHDSVRTVQCALKYATPEQKKQIANELKGSYKELAESRYAKFLVGKILVAGDDGVRDMVVGEFCGNVRRLINHPEASWILDDTYRQMATKQQKAKLLREWYGPEFSVFKSAAQGETLTADILTILESTPEKRQPIMQYLLGLINQLIQKKMHGFTMLHDAMLQYSLAISTPKTLHSADISSVATSTAHQEWLELLKPTEETDFDLLRNLGFTASGVRVVARALALSTAKDRKLLLRPYKDHIETLACDTNGVSVLLAAYETVDDTVMLSKLVHPELLAAKLVDADERASAVSAIGVHPMGRTAMLWTLTNSDERWPKWLVNPSSPTAMLIREIRDLRVVTSKKAASQRRAELAKAQITASDNAMLVAVEKKVSQLAADSFGCQFITETFLAAEAAHVSSDAAMRAVADLAAGDASVDGHASQSSAANRMFKTLVQRGRFDVESSSVAKLDGPSDGLVRFPALLWEHMAPQLAAWATGDGSFVVVALTENQEFERRGEVLSAIKGVKKALKTASADGKGEKEKGNAGSKILLEKV